MPEGEPPDEPVTVPYPRRRRPENIDPTDPRPWNPDDEPWTEPEDPTLQDDPLPGPWIPKPPGRPDPIGG